MSDRNATGDTDPRVQAAPGGTEEEGVYYVQVRESDPFAR